MEETRRFEGLRLGDLAGLVVGYSLAALPAKLFLPNDFLARGPFFLLCAGSVYLWMGLALSGPIVLGLDRSRREKDDGENRAPRMRHTRAELCWLLIGGYWYIMIGFAATMRLPGMSWVLFFVLPIIGVVAVAVGSLFRNPKRVTPIRAWTHRAAVGLLTTWPVAWGLLIAIAWELQ